MESEGVDLMAEFGLFSTFPVADPHYVLAARINEAGTHIGLVRRIVQTVPRLWLVVDYRINPLADDQFTQEGRLTGPYGALFEWDDRWDSWLDFWGP